MARRADMRGFTLLEVLVAVAILGLGLTSILSVQFSAVTGTAHARHMGVALGLARCKMSEIEEQLRVEGLPEVGFEDRGLCCEGDNTPNMSCSWVVERPTFPEGNYGQLDLDADLEGTALGKLADAAGNDGASSDVSSLASSLAGGDAGELAAAGIGGIASMVMSMVYPDLKALFEASTRKVTVVLTWTEGDRQYDIELVQWVTQPQPGLLPDLDGLTAEDDEASGSTNSSGTSPGGGSRGGNSPRTAPKIGAGR